MYYPHDFHMINRHLHCEGVKLSRIADALGTPAYVYSHKTLLDHLRKLKAAFRKLDPLICFSVKANGNLAVIKLLVEHGAGLDVVSSGELYKALRAGCPPSKIVFASVGKRIDEIEQALRARIFCFNVESAPELEAIDTAARKLRTIAAVALRINPDVEAHTHRYVTTGTAESKFGIEPRLALSLLGRHSYYSGLRFIGLHLHIGSQITKAKPFIEAIHKVSFVIKQSRSLGLRLEWLNLGGGLGIIYKDERPQTPREFAEQIIPHLRPLDIRLILEPGRFIVGNAGILLSRVLYVKEARGKHFAVIDAGMNDLIRPALYGAYHEVIPVVASPGAVKSHQRYDVVGPVCESADVFATNRRLGHVASGDLLAILGSGAYGYSMASNYNGRLRPPEVLVSGRRFALIRRRETLRDLIRHDVIPRAILG